MNRYEIAFLTFTAIATVCYYQAAQSARYGYRDYARRWMLLGIMASGVLMTILLF